MTAKKHPVEKPVEADVASPEVKSAPEGIAPLPADKDAVVATPRPTAVGGAGTIVKPPSSDDLKGGLAAAMASGVAVSIIVRNESDASSVRQLLGNGKVRRVVKIKPNQGVRAMWRAIADG